MTILKSTKTVKATKASQIINPTQKFTWGKILYNNHIRAQENHDQFWVLSYVQNNNKIIETKSALTIKLGLVYFSISQKCIEKLISLVPKKLKGISQGKNLKTVKRPLSPHSSFNKGKVPELKNLSALMNSSGDMRSERYRYNSLVKNLQTSKNSDASSCKYMVDNI
jgi:hypothetical protein